MPQDVEKVGKLSRRREVWDEKGGRHSFTTRSAQVFMNLSVVSSDAASLRAADGLLAES